VYESEGKNEKKGGDKVKQRRERERERERKENSTRLHSIV
jgi:hypothetical protein